MVGGKIDRNICDILMEVMVRCSAGAGREVHCRFQSPPWRTKSFFWPCACVIQIPLHRNPGLLRILAVLQQFLNLVLI